MSGYALGGNKMRQLDFILAEAIAGGAEILVTTAGSQSNFCRSLAGAAAQLGLDCHLHLRAAMGTALVGNLLLDDIFGADDHVHDRYRPLGPRHREELRRSPPNTRRPAARRIVVQLTGAAPPRQSPAGSRALPNCVRDFESGSGMPDKVVVVCGSGLSLAGLALGFKHFGCPTRLIGISAQQPAARLKPWIVSAAREAAARLGFGTRLEESDFDIVDSEIGPGYGMPSTASIAAVRLAGRTEGIVLDPVYTGKGLAGVQAALRDGRIEKTRFCRLPAFWRDARPVHARSRHSRKMRRLEMRGL